MGADDNLRRELREVAGRVIGLALHLVRDAYAGRCPRCGYQREQIARCPHCAAWTVGECACEGAQRQRRVAAEVTRDTPAEVDAQNAEVAARERAEWTATLERMRAELAADRKPPQRAPVSRRRVRAI